MMEILKTKSHMIGKLFVYQIAMSLLGLFVASPFSGSMQIVAAVFSTLFFFSLVCYAVIEDGQKDCVSVKAGRMTGNAFSGFVYTFVMYIPTIIIVVTQMLLFLCTGKEVLTALKAVLAIIIRVFLMGMYLGFENGLMDRQYDKVTETMVSNASEAVQFFCNNYMIFAVFLIIFPVVCGISYYLAYKGKIHVDTQVKNRK
ncbi:MAG: hypothetical protein J6K12_02110 [Clostridia bacterium]|nr:hypothetical protein [Clostridia bacterium]